jgi:hypothetical protein
MNPAKKTAGRLSIAGSGAGSRASGRGAGCRGRPRPSERCTLGSVPVRPCRRSHRRRRSCPRTSALWEGRRFTPAVRRGGTVADGAFTGALLSRPAAAQTARTGVRRDTDAKGAAQAGGGTIPARLTHAARAGTRRSAQGGAGPQSVPVLQVRGHRPVRHLPRRLRGPPPLMAEGHRGLAPVLAIAVARHGALPPAQGGDPGGSGTGQTAQGLPSRPDLAEAPDESIESCGIHCAGPIRCTGGHPHPGTPRERLRPGAPGPPSRRGRPSSLCAPDG